MTKECILILDNLRSIENVGSIFRTADGFGVSKIVLTGTTPAPLDRFSRVRTDLAKVALGAEKSVSWEYQTNTLNVVEGLRKDGYKILALEQDNRSRRLKELVPPDKFAIVVGNEVGGVQKEILDVADVIVEIPMEGAKESLNVSVATGVALFHLLK